MPGTGVFNGKVHLWFLELFDCLNYMPILINVDLLIISKRRRVCEITDNFELMDVSKEYFLKRIHGKRNYSNAFHIQICGHKNCRAQTFKLP